MNWLLDESQVEYDFTLNREVPIYGDQRNGYYYHYTPDLIRAINISLATTRPLLLCGEPGCGKTSMAFNLARILKRRYYEQIINSRTEATDLLWQFDHIRRLADANVTGRLPEPPLDKFNYLEPGMLWWAFDPASAMNRGYEGKMPQPAIDPCLFKPDNKEAPAVILIDEIDKAEPDLPNNLLEVIGAQTFRVNETGSIISLEKQRLKHARDYPLLVITTNQERELPPAFVRRCIVYRFPPPNVKQMKAIARKTLPNCVEIDKLCQAILEHYKEAQLPDIAEFLDTLIAADTLRQIPGWEMNQIEAVLAMTVNKQAQLERP